MYTTILSRIQNFKRGIAPVDVVTARAYESSNRCSFCGEASHHHRRLVMHISKQPIHMCIKCDSIDHQESGMPMFIEETKNFSCYAKYRSKQKDWEYDIFNKAHNRVFTSDVTFKKFRILRLSAKIKLKEYEYSTARIESGE